MSSSRGRGLVIVGAGGNASDVLDIVDGLAAAGERWDVIGFLDDHKPVGTAHCGFQVVGRFADAERFAGHWFVNSVRNEATYAKVAGVIERTGRDRSEFATLVDPRAVISQRSSLGAGVYVGAGVVISGGVTVGDHVSIGPGVTVGHNTTIGSFATLAPAAVISGWVRVGQACYVGAGAAVKQGLEIGDGALVGMGAVVVHDVAPGTVVVGNPARLLTRDAS